ncbi:ABC-type antimicrobial peptide transport system, ATPase component [Desulfitobacterium dehalogenans ATCC 51507]|uniref:ABC-type antimicrobial peptide transport system, ATPase component n=1 Tax=Desulfitobacterium dehalogenans (strain ATCC 51507 / DSM 9161 / JW/IU-DC1) TaxID=756499 RepID=I4A3I6_DESDJ|nr:ATP-binding cassette domain-containing protein [Desulfitobacterium dehalogenans]AFL98520.1 ABC-type antimicrobial peptide transport system, ATPase component [Desulfitobacterium dehalogenans ATCC 51507]
MSLCRLEKVSKSYKMGEVVCPLNEVSLTVEKGDFLAIEGPSGTGKSTLLYIMCGLLMPTGGEVFLKDHHLRSLSDAKVTELRRDLVGFVFQETNLFQALTVEGNLRFVQSVGKDRKPDEAKISRYLEELGLSSRRNFLPNQLSVGQRRRLIVARALINDPQLVLADEPTNDLDEMWAGKIMSLLAGVVERGGAVVMVTHNSHWAEKANKRYLMQEGRLVKHDQA